MFCVVISGNYNIKVRISIAGIWAVERFLPIKSITLSIEGYNKNGNTPWARLQIYIFLATEILPKEKGYKFENQLKEESVR